MKIVSAFTFALFQSLLLISEIRAQNNNSSDTNVKTDFLRLVIGIFEKLEPNCFSSLYQLLHQNERSKYEKDKKYPWLSDTIGKGFNDIGDETECLNSIKENTTFFLINLNNINMDNFLETDHELKNYLEIKNFAFGFCIMDECVETIKKNLKIVAKFVNYMDTLELSNENFITLIESSKRSNNPDNAYKTDKMETVIFKQCLVYLLLVLMILKLIGSIIRIIIIPKGYNKYVAEKINQLKKSLIKDKKKSNDSEENSKLSSKSLYDEELKEESISKDYNPLFDFSEKLPTKIRILRAFDLINDYKYLSWKRNRYFNDSGLEILTFNRAFVIFSFIFSNTFSTLINFPSEEILNDNFFGSWMYIFYRLTNNALICWIFLEGAYTTYKLLCFISAEMFFYLKKEDKKHLYYKIKLLIIYGKFLVLLIPKFLVFILIYYIIYYKIESYRFASSSPATFKFIIENLLKKGITCNDIFSIFDIRFSTDIKNYDVCYEFTYFYINMILSIFIFMIISYLFFIIKNKIFELFIIGINIIFFFVSILLINDDKTKVKGFLLHYHIIGQTYSSKIFISFIGFFHLGFIFGFLIFNSENLKLKIIKLIYEYNKGLNLSKTNIKFDDTKSVLNSMSECSVNLSSQDYSFNSRASRANSSDFQFSEDSPYYYKNFILPYYPLRYLNNIIKPIHKLKLYYKIALILGGFALLILIDLILLLFIYTRESFTIKLNRGNKFMFLYEKHFFIIIYFLMNVLLLTIPKKSAIRRFMGSKIFIATSRIGFVITCVVQAFTYLSLLIFFIKVKLYVPTFAVISIGNFLFFFIICSILTIFMELPLRIAIKKILRIERKKERSKKNIIF